MDTAANEWGALSQIVIQKQQKRFNVEFIACCGDELLLYDLPGSSILLFASKLSFNI